MVKGCRYRFSATPQTTSRSGNCASRHSTVAKLLLLKTKIASNKARCYPVCADIGPKDWTPSGNRSVVSNDDGKDQSVSSGNALLQQCALASGIQASARIYSSWPCGRDIHRQPVQRNWREPTLARMRVPVRHRYRPGELHPRFTIKPRLSLSS